MVGLRRSGVAHDVATGGAETARPLLARALVLTKLSLSGFRNYGSLRIEAGPGLTVLTGPNGAGKTNLLEAVSLLAPGRGLRAATYGDLLQTPDATRWAVAGTLEGPYGEVRVGTAFERVTRGDADGNGRLAPVARRVQIDGEPQRGSGALAPYVRMLWLTPAMDRLFVGSAGDRRRFLDRLVIAFDPEHGQRVQNFERLIRERNRLLELGRPDPAWLAGLETQMAEFAVAIAASRRSVADTLAPLMGEDETTRNTGGFPWGRLRLDGQLEQQIREVPAVQIEEQYRRMLHDSRAHDAAAGRTTQGPHRSDFTVVHGPKGAEARHCSTGEQKALLIALILAHARAISSAFGGYAPIVLLDEVAAHLDAERRRGLFRALSALGVQAWMTGTEPALFRAVDEEARFLRVEDGSVEDVIR